MKEIKNRKQTCIPEKFEMIKRINLMTYQEEYPE